jgi:phage N-6-adenine-methyltransferase
MKRERDDNGDYKSDLWRTPPWLFKILNEKYNFAMDLAASPKNKLLPSYFSLKNSALKNDWPKLRFSFGNPPFSVPNLSKFTARAATMANQQSYSVMLLPAYVMEDWFKDYVYQDASEIILLNGRLKYYTADGKESLGNRFGSCIVEFGSRAYKGPCKKIRWKSIEEIRQTGSL